MQLPTQLPIQSPSHPIQLTIIFLLLLVLDHVQKAIMEDQVTITVVKVVKEDVLLPVDGVV
jgi:hypothetical protein